MDITNTFFKKEISEHHSHLCFYSDKKKSVIKFDKQMEILIYVLKWLGLNSHQHCLM